MVHFFSNPASKSICINYHSNTYILLAAGLCFQTGSNSNCFFFSLSLSFLFFIILTLECKQVVSKKFALTSNSRKWLVKRMNMTGIVIFSKHFIRGRGIDLLQDDWTSHKKREGASIQIEGSFFSLCADNGSSGHPRCCFFQFRVLTALS